MARRRRAEAHQILAAKFRDRAQQLMLIAQPCFMFGDDRRSISVTPDPERISHLLPRPPAGIPTACLFRTLHIFRSFALSRSTASVDGRRIASGLPPVTGALGRARRGTAQPLTCAATRYDGTALGARPMPPRRPSGSSELLAEDGGSEQARDTSCRYAAPKCAGAR